MVSCYVFIIYVGYRVRKTTAAFANSGAGRDDNEAAKKLQKTISRVIVLHAMLPIFQGLLPASDAASKSARARATCFLA